MSEENKINLMLSQFDAFLVTDLLRYRLIQIETSQNNLIKSIFESRKKILFASFGHKYGTLRGWHKVDPYLNQSTIINEGKTARDKFIQLHKENDELNTLTKIYSQLTTHPICYTGIPLETLQEKLEIRWTELISILSNFGHKLSKEDCEGRLNRIYRIWEIEEDRLKEKIN